MCKFGGSKEVHNEIIFIPIFFIISAQSQNNDRHRVQLVELSLIPDQELDGEMISGLFSQKTVWLLPCESLNSKIEFRVSSYQIVISTQMMSESHIKLLSYQIIMTVSKYQSLRHFFQSLTLYYSQDLIVNSPLYLLHISL